jgi:hypothetical protein
MLKKIYLNKNLNENILFISGISRSGKSLFAPIVSTLDKTQNFQMIPEIEEIFRLYYIGKISKEIASYIIKIYVNIKTYENYIGRNFNFRKKEWTSIYNYKNIYEIKSILKIPHDVKTFHKINKNQILFPFMIHDGVLFFKLVLSIYNKCKFIHINRHPVDLVHSWANKFVGDFHKNDPKKNFHNFLQLEYKNKTRIPYWLVSKVNEYTKIHNFYDRIIFNIYYLLEKQNNIYEMLSKNDKKKIHIVYFDNFVTDPNNELNKICNFLSTKFTKNTKKILRRERCPREINLQDRYKKLIYLNQIISENSKKLLKKIYIKHENRVGLY